MTTTLTEEMPDLDLSDLQVEEDRPTPTRTRKARSDAGQPRGRRASTGLLVEQLLVPWGTIALAASQPVPLVSAVMLDRGEPTMKALVEIASGHPKMLNALRKAAKAGPASELFQTGAMLLLAAAIETGRVPAEVGIARRSGMTDLYYQLHPDRVQQSSSESSDAPFSFVPPGL